MLQVKPASTGAFKEIQTELDSLSIEADCDIIIGGDFNVILDPEFDGLGGKPKLKESAKIIEQIRLSFDLIDIWRVRNPNERRFSWRQKNPVIQRRSDFWLTSSSLQEDVESVDTLYLRLNRITQQSHCLLTELTMNVMGPPLGSSMQG